MKIKKSFYFPHLAIKTVNKKEGGEMNSLEKKYPGRKLTKKCF